MKRNSKNTGGKHQSSLVGKLTLAARYYLIFILFHAISIEASSQTIIGNQIDYAAPLNYRIAGITV